MTWEYEEVKFQPNDINNDKGLLTKVFKKNCSLFLSCLLIFYFYNGEHAYLLRGRAVW